jgi:protein N-terminal amidase
MKIACLQFAPEMGKVQENIAKADEILRNTRMPVGLDWLVLPELAFTGMSHNGCSALDADNCSAS